MAKFRVNEHVGNHKCIDFICNLDLNQRWLVTVEKEKNNRSLAQNRMYWQWNGIMGNEIGCTADDWHQEMMRMFLPSKFYTISGKTEERAKSTKKLTVKEFTEYLEHIDRHCASFHGAVLPHPEDTQRNY